MTRNAITPAAARARRDPAGGVAVAGPAPATHITEGYARAVARDAYFWAWPMVSLYGRRLACAAAPRAGLARGVLPWAPLDALAMAHDLVPAEQRSIACADQDLVSGAGIAALEYGPVVVQIPDFGGRFWVYQCVDLRTDEFADIGATYRTEPGFHLLVGPDWDEQVPDGIARIFRSPTDTALVCPRVALGDGGADDRRALQVALSGIDMYPLARFDGAMRERDWSRLPSLPLPAGHDDGGEIRWVDPGRFFDRLPAVLADAPPRPGEAARYDEVLAVLTAAASDPALEAAIADEAWQAEARLVDPLLHFRNAGVPLAHHWTTTRNGAQFGSDYFARTALARSGLLAGKPIEATYFHQDLDATGARLDGRAAYTVTFAPGALPPVRGPWSLTLYDRFHFLVANARGRCAVGTRTRDLACADDGSLTIHVQSRAPDDAAARANWLPAPDGEDFSLVLRAYSPQRAILDGAWSPPPVVRTRA